MSSEELDQLLREQAADHLWMHGGWTREEALNHDKLRFIVKGDGIYVTDADGSEYMDGLSCMYVMNVGHGRKEVSKAVYEQMELLSYSGSYSSTMIPTVKLAAKIAKHTPLGMSKVNFTSGGAESNETALKVARQYQRIKGYSGKSKFISRKGSYHGNTFGTMSISQNQGYHHELYEPLLEGVKQISQPHRYRCDHCKGMPKCNLECANELERVILEEGKDTVAAFISEPISVSAGIVVPPDGYWQKIRDICNKYGILLIFDEVITGFGRTGKWFASEHWGVVPDIISTAKGISSGYLPRGAIIVRDEVAEVFSGENKFPHGITFASHPVACAAAIANLEIIENETLVERSAEMGKYLMEKLQPLYEHASVGEIRGIGLLVGIELVKDKNTKERFPSNIWSKFNLKALEKGLRIKMGNVIALAPPFIITREQIDEMVSIVDELITEIEADQGLD